MSHLMSMEKCKAFIDCQLSAAKSSCNSAGNMHDRLTVTVSRQTGSGAHSIAEKLAAYLEAHQESEHCPWTVFDKNIVYKVLEDHHLPGRLAQYMPERKISDIDDAVGELLGLHPSAWTMVEHTTETILRLAKMGNVILVGRGAPVIASKLNNAFHVRLIGSPAKRAEHASEFYHLTNKEALAFVEKEDRERERYLKKYFHRNIDDPLLYHLIINTDKVTFDEAARTIGEMVLRRQKSLESSVLSAV